MRTLAITPSASVAFALTTTIASSQFALFHIDGTAPGARLGDAVRGVGDVNGDGVVDVFIGSPLDSSLVPLGGTAVVVSGIDGSTLFALRGTEFSQFGSDAAGLGDVNGDGFGEFAVGAPLDSTRGFRRGITTVYSGIDGSELYTIEGPRINGWFGSEVVNMGDLDGDSVDDLAVGAARGALGPASGKGAVLLHSGATGAWIRTIEGPFDDSQFGVTVARAGDFDGDGREDVLVGSPRERGHQGAARVYSSATGSLLFERVSPTPTRQFGSGAIALPDVDGDGTPEIIIGQATEGRVEAYSGASQTLLWGTEAIADQGWILEPYVDVDEDGVLDFLTTVFNSELWVRSGRTGAILQKMQRRFPVPDAPRNQLARLEDLDGDGSVEFAMGASNRFGMTNVGLQHVGSAFVLSGARRVQRSICNAHPSAGDRLIAQGSIDPADNRLTLTVGGVFNDAFGYFITSLGNEIIPSPTGSGPPICIGDSVGGIGRHLDSLGQADFDGALQYELDLNDIPTPTGAVSVLAGETRYWQHWSRATDSFGGPITVFSEAIAVDFL